MILKLNFLKIKKLKTLTLKSSSKKTCFFIRWFRLIFRKTEKAYDNNKISSSGSNDDSNFDNSSDDSLKSPEEKVEKKEEKTKSHSATEETNGDQMIKIS